MTDGAHVDREVAVERLDLGAGSWVDVARGWLARTDELYEHLLANVAWQTSQLFRYDYLVEERRLGASWRSGTPLPHPAWPRPPACCSTATGRGSTGSA